MAKLPPRVAGKKKKSAEKNSEKRDRESGDESAAPVERTVAARNFGIITMIVGAIATVAPLFGLQVRRFGQNTAVVGFILLVIGGVSFGVSQSRATANLATLGMKIVMWGIIGLLLLILVGAAALVLFR